MSLNTLFNTLMNLVKDNPSDWVIFVLGLIVVAFFAVLSVVARTVWIKFSQSRKEDAFVLGKFHGYLTAFVNLYDSYQLDSYSYMGNRLEDKMEIISYNVTHLVSKSELKIDSNILNQLKSIANDYYTFAHRMKYMGESVD